MQIDITLNQVYAAGRHVASYVAGGVSVAVALHFLSPSQGGDLGTSINQVSDGITQIAKGIAGICAVLTPIYTAWRAAHSASPTQEAISLVSAKPGTIVVTTPEIAQATPNVPNIVSNEEKKVVSQ